MEVTSVPTLQALAEPLGQPGALPDGVSLSIGLIATTRPAVLSEAARNAHGDFYIADIESDPDTGKSAEQHYYELRAKLGDVQALDPTAQNIEDNPHLVDARDDFVDAMVSRASAQLDLPGFESMARLSNEVDSDVRRLSRAGWLASTAAGFIIGASAALGLTFSHESPQAPATATQSEQADYEAVRSMEAVADVVVPVSGALLGGGVGLGIGVRLRGQFARRRARSMVRKAGGTL